jgi:cytochrome c551/c552
LAQAGGAAAAYGELKVITKGALDETHLTPFKSFEPFASLGSFARPAGRHRRARCPGQRPGTCRLGRRRHARAGIAQRLHDCHHIDPGSKGPNGLAPVGPAWRDVSNKYTGQRGAEDSLTLTVLGGSNPYASHWKGQASGLAMPPNQVAISEADARKLVKWILALGPTK